MFVTVFYSLHLFLFCFVFFLPFFPLHWQADSQPLRHQGSPEVGLLYFKYMFKMAPHYTKCVTTLFLSLCCLMMMRLLLTGTSESFRYFTSLPRNKFLMHSWAHAIMIPRIIPHA